MIDYDFIEIGSSDHDTLLDGADINVKGILIEPIKIYLDRLPNYPNVLKLNIAISPNNEEGDADIYYVPPEVIESNPHYHLTLKGCNSIGVMHSEQINWGLQEYVKTLKVKLVSFPKLLEEYKVRGIKHLKIDIEGGDSELLLNFLEYLNKKTKEYYPKKITFESNRLTPKDVVDKVVMLYQQLGYKVISRDFNTILSL